MIRASSRRWWLWPALGLVTLAVYQPAWHGGPVWDDDTHLTRVWLRSIVGLYRIWFDLGATQQYYPVVHSAFWVFHRLWGDNPFGYHLVNIALHATSAYLVAIILWRLRVPGAVLAAVVFAVHPIEVESVAWMTELKNTLSGVCYLAALLAYLQFDDSRDRRFYRLALVIFAVAILSKTVTATLPAALLVIFWWQRGRVSWSGDARPLLPFFACGLAAGVLTAWVEHRFIGATGPDFQYTFLERALVAGRAVWFYLGKLLWPVDLAFIYPQWVVDSGAWWQYLYPAALILALVFLWRLRSRSRAPLAAALLFCGTLFPALGFVDVYSFRYAFVADHFQYLAGIPIVALVSAGLVSARATGLQGRLREAALVFVIGVPLAVATFHRSHEYVDRDSLFRATIVNNPACWMCRTNLALSLVDQGDLVGAEGLLRESLALKPDNAETHNDLGALLQRMGRVQEAVGAHLKAITYDPRLAKAHYNLALAYFRLGRYQDAATAVRVVIRLRPDFAPAQEVLRQVLAEIDRQAKRPRD